MAKTHEVPTHLNGEDKLFVGLTARQLATFMAFASPAYGIWDQFTVAPVPVRGAFAAAVVLVGIVFMLVQPGQRPLDEWAFAVFAFLTLGRRLSWRRAEPDPNEWRSGAAPDWADFEPRLGWADARAFDSDDAP
jgi:hypothetical protein